MSTELEGLCPALHQPQAPSQPLPQRTGPHRWVRWRGTCRGGRCAAAPRTLVESCRPRSRPGQRTCPCSAAGCCRSRCFTSAPSRPSTRAGFLVSDRCRRGRHPAIRDRAGPGGPGEGAAGRYGQPRKHHAGAHARRAPAKKIPYKLERAHTCDHAYRCIQFSL